MGSRQTVWVTSFGQQRRQVIIGLICLPCKFTNVSRHPNPFLWVNTLPSRQLSSIQLYSTGNSPQSAGMVRVFELAYASVKLAIYFLDSFMAISWYHASCMRHALSSLQLFYHCVILARFLFVSKHIDSCRYAYIGEYRCGHLAIRNCTPFNMFRRKINE